MPDRYNASIRIGGTIDRTTDSQCDPEMSALNVMLAMINGADVSHEWGDAVAVICEGEDDELLQYTNDNGLLEFKGESVINGEFDELETFLREHDIPYNRSTCAYGGYLGEDVYWMPGMEQPLVILGDDHGTDYVSREDISILLHTLKEGRDADTFVDMARELVHTAIEKLEEVCPDPPDIPPFKIVGEKP